MATGGMHIVIDTLSSVLRKSRPKFWGWMFKKIFCKKGVTVNGCRVTPHYKSK
jgi:hypothetical protein